MTKINLLGIKIHGGMTSEARVFAGLLGARGGDYDASVIYHAWPGADNGAEEFAQVSSCPLELIDCGWRSGFASGWKKAAALLRLRLSLPKVVRIARTQNPDIIYSSQQLWDCATASYVADRLKKPQVIHLHYPVGPWLQSGFSGNPRLLLTVMSLLGLAKPLDRLLRCERVVTVSEFIRAEALRHGCESDRVAAVFNSIAIPPLPDENDRTEIRREWGAAEGDPVVGIVGRFDPDKGHADTLEAFGRCAERFPRARLALVGEGPLRPALQERALSLGLAGRTHFLGQRADVPRLLGAMDIFCHPSRQEACGLALLEASAAGLPLLSYAEGGPVEIVDCGRTGLLATPGNVDDLADKLAVLLTDIPAARAMGAAGRARMDMLFSPALAAEKFGKILQGMAV